MGRKSTFNQYKNKICGGVKIIESVGVHDGRLRVKCLCLNCKKDFLATFHNVYRGNYKSCGCLQFALNSSNPRWQGYGEISHSYFHSMKEGAARKRLTFSLSIEDLWEIFLKQNKKCALSGVELRFPRMRKECNWTASLDRIDSSKGYIEGNVQWVDRKVNFAKQKLNNQDFLDLIKSIYEYNFK